MRRENNNETYRHRSSTSSRTVSLAESWGADVSLPYVRVVIMVVMQLRRRSTCSGENIMTVHDRRTPWPGSAWGVPVYLCMDSPTTPYTVLHTMIVISYGRYIGGKPRHELAVRQQRIGFFFGLALLEARLGAHATLSSTALGPICYGRWNNNGWVVWGFCQIQTSMKTMGTMLGVFVLS
jgi:hypothetical protein